MRVKDSNKARVSPNDIYSYMVVEKGVSPNHAQGILANIQAESNFISTAYGDQGTSAGLFQHHAERKDNLMKAVGSDLTNWKGQVDFALSESGSKKYLNQTFASPEDASRWWTVNWERPSDSRNKAEQRLGFLNTFSPTVAIGSTQIQPPTSIQATDFAEVPQNFFQSQTATIDYQTQATEKLKEQQKALDLQEQEARKKLENKRLERDYLAEQFSSISQYVPRDSPSTQEVNQ